MIPIHLSLVYLPMTLLVEQITYLLTTSFILGTFKKICCLHWGFFHSIWPNYSGVTDFGGKWGWIVLLALVLLDFSVFGCRCLWSTNWTVLSATLESWWQIRIYVGNRFRIKTVVFLIFNEACKLLLSSNRSSTSLFFYCGESCSNSLDLYFLQNYIIHSLFQFLFFKHFLLYFGILNHSEFLSFAHRVDWELASVKIILRNFHICVHVIMVVFAIRSKFLKRTSCFSILSKCFVLQCWRLKVLTQGSLIPKFLLNEFLLGLVLLFGS